MAEIKGKPSPRNVVQDEALDPTDLINEEVDGQNIRRKYVITSKGKAAVFPVEIVTKPEYGREAQYFSVRVHPNFPKDYKVDDGNAMLVGVLGKGAKLSASLFEGEKDGKPYLGLEIKAQDGYKFQYSARGDNRKTTHGFWFSSGERKALSLMGYLDLVEIK